MAVDYESLRKENERRYGTDIGRIGPMLLADRYDDRTHFIFELLQNAEDALARRQGWQGSRAVRFTLSATELRVTHCGQSFNDPDVRGICGIAEGTKEKDCTAIGQFGIGFKSVNAFTDRPEIHSGDEDFAIEYFVRPIAIPAFDRQADETVFVLPLRAGDEAAHAQIAEGLRRLGPRTLLFLRQIDEIAWRVDGGPSGLYVRGKSEPIGKNIRRIDLLGEEDGKPDVEETWLLFSREAEMPDGKIAGHVEIAFAINPVDECGRYSIQAISDSPLVVFFPTVLPTYLGFLVQGPYRTTPSRDNVPRNDPWNQHLVEETATLLVDALRLLRARGLLDVDALRCLPLDRTKFGEGHMFAPLFAAVREAFRTEPLLPTAGEDHTAAGTAKLARTHELRELLSPRQLASVFGADGDLFWLSGSITQDRTPELRQYMMRELDIVEVTPETILPKLTQAFLQEQSDEWTRQLYEFLHGQPALLRQGRLKDVPLVRLEDGSHVTPTKDGRPQAFLPGPIATNFPTVRSVACETETARALLLELGLTEPDPVDDVVWNVLPKYVREEIGVGDAEYETDIRRILTAFGTEQREKLLAALRESFFVMAVDAGNGSKSMSKPGGVYLATERLKNLFGGVAGVLLVDYGHSCLRGEDVRELLEACGATRYLQPVPVSSRFNWQELADMRTRAGVANNTGADIVEDFTLRGLDKLLATWAEPTAEAGAKKAALLWESLCDVEDRRGKTVFLGTYKWFYFQRRSCVFDAAFVQQLNATAWVPDANGDLQCPNFVVFDTLGWEPNPFLLSKIRFRPPIIDQLAKEAGIEPAVLDMLKKLGLTSVTGLMARLKVDEANESDEQTRSSDDGEQTSRNTRHGAPAETPASRDDRGDSNAGDETGSGNAHPDAEKQPSNASSSSGKGSTRQPNNGLERRFVSYVATHPEDDDEAERDGLSHAERLALEQQAISLIRSREPLLQVMPAGNKGFDLVETDTIGVPQRWIEVKAMKGSLEDRPVGLSSVQFEFARQHGEQYWLYVVEHAGASDMARIVKVQNPAGRTGTFTFDHGWIEIADIDGPLQKAS